MIHFDLRNPGSDVLSIALRLRFPPHASSTARFAATRDRVIGMDTMPRIFGRSSHGAASTGTADVALSRFMSQRIARAFIFRANALLAG